MVIVLFVVAIGITVALAISSRSATEVTLSTTQDESSRALEAAQAGLERYLGGVPFPNDVPGVGGGDTITETNASYFVPTAGALGEGQQSYRLPYLLIAGDTATIDMPGVGENYSGVRVCWGNTGQPKIEVAFYYCQRTSAQSCNPPITGQYLVKRKGYDPAASAAYTGFLDVNGTSACGTGVSFNHTVAIGFGNDSGNNIDLPSLSNNNSGRNRVFFMRIKMLGNGSVPQPLAIQLTGAGGTGLPRQAGIVESTGTSGESVQKIRATVTNLDLPPMFDSAVFSGTSIVK